MTMTQWKLLTCPFALALLAASMMLAFGVAVADDEIPKSEEILRRYIPASRLDAVATKDSPGVLLPIAEFEQLLRNAEAKAGDGGPRPAGASLVRADYALKV